MTDYSGNTYTAELRGDDNQVQAELDFIMRTPSLRRQLEAERDALLSRVFTEEERSWYYPCEDYEGEGWDWKRNTPEGVIYAVYNHANEKAWVSEEVYQRLKKNIWEEYNPQTEQFRQNPWVPTPEEMERMAEEDARKEAEWEAYDEWRRMHD